LKRRALALALSMVAMQAGAAECVSDYEREQAWQSQVVPQLVVGEPVRFAGHCPKSFWGIYAEPAGASRVEPAGASRTEPAEPPRAVLLAHDMGVHPDYGLTHALRIALADAGFATLAIQMPVLPISVGPYAYEALVMDEAERRIDESVRWLEAKGFRGRIALVSQGLGSRMANFYVADSGGALSSWVAISIPARYERLDRVRTPILDLYAEHDSAEVLALAPARIAQIAHIPGAQQAIISGAAQEFETREKEVARTVRAFLARPHRTP